MVRMQLSSREVDFILYIAKYQNDSGIVSSVYYKDVCSAISISIQKFYDIIGSLQDKGLITVEKVNSVDMSVALVGNSFLDKDFSVGYLNVSSMDFRKEKFIRMKAGSKLLYLYMQRFVKGKHMMVQNFYDSFCGLFGRTKKCLQKYLSELKKNFFLFVSKKRNKAYHYEMTIKNSTVLNIPEINIPREKDGLIDNIKKMLSRNFKKYIPGKDGEKILENIADLVFTKKAEKIKNIANFIVDAVKESLKQQKREKKEQPVLNAALVNKHFTLLLGE